MPSTLGGFSTEKPCYHPWQREWVENRKNSTRRRGKRSVHGEKADRNQPRLNKFGLIPVRELPQKAQRESTQISVIWVASRVGILTRKATLEANQKEEIKNQHKKIGTDVDVCLFRRQTDYTKLHHFYMRNQILHIPKPETIKKV